LIAVEDGSVMLGYTHSEYSKTDQKFLREFNTRKILDILRSKKALSRAEIAEISHLDKKTITNIVNDLLESGQVSVFLKESNGVGRPKERLSLDGNYCRTIGLDIGGDHISGVILDFQGSRLADYWLDIDCNVAPDELINYCEYVINHLLKDVGITIENINSIGISFPGHLDNVSGFTVLSENLPTWHNVEIKRIFENKLQKPIVVEDCSRLMALAELWYGQGRNHDNLVIFDLGFGIGSGLIINNVIYSGARDKAGEIGHTIVKEHGPKCTCGRNGCLEALASGWAILKHAETILRDHPESILAKTTRNNHNHLTTQDVALAADMGDEECRKLLLEAGHFIGVSVANTISFLNPEMVVLGGSLVQDNTILIESILKDTKRLVIPELYKDTEIVASELGRYASALGAATLCIQCCLQ
jgi:glucokinase-like ROK family protein